VALDRGTQAFAPADRLAVHDEQPDAEICCRFAIPTPMFAA
jgi:hypothetical protein